MTSDSYPLDVLNLVLYMLIVSSNASVDIEIETLCDLLKNGMEYTHDFLALSQWHAM